MGCTLSSSLEKTVTQPGNDSIIAEVAADPKNEAESKRGRTTSKDCQRTIKNKVVDRTLLIKFIKTLESPSMGKCPVFIDNLMYVTDNKTSDCLPIEVLRKT